MSSTQKTIQKRTNKVRTEIQHEWHDIWWKFIIDNPDNDWKWKEISRNPNLTMQIINDNPDKDWDYISMNSNLTMDFINDNPKKHWNW